MIKKYRIKTPIEAEQFDGSKEMMERYEIMDSGNKSDDRYWLDGFYLLYIGDYIVSGISEKYEIVKPEFFEGHYKEITNEDNER